MLFPCMNIQNEITLKKDFLGSISLQRRKRKSCDFFASESKTNVRIFYYKIISSIQKRGAGDLLDPYEAC